MQVDSNLKAKYNPARIHQSQYSNANHVTQPQFSDEELGKPNPPLSPALTDDNWMPIQGTIILLFLIPFIPAFALFGLIGLWVWAIFTRLSTDPNKITALKEKYNEAIKYYNEVELPNWQKNKPFILQEKLADFNDNILYYLIIQQGWYEELDVDEKYIGMGEQEVFDAICVENIKACRHVRVQDNYTADIVCFNPKSGKLCVVEIDGKQHWEDPSQVNRDNQRMQDLATKGIPTIRFINFFARENSKVCAGHVEKLLAWHRPI
ncbi:hypothetical protein CAL7716_059140 [Calothrix sp. PCC 7716]|nr:hypothetical protein CAL7716_059140 [Calothrix sp. PCC 7716]